MAQTFWQAQNAQTATNNVPQGDYLVTLRFFRNLNHERLNTMTATKKTTDLQSIVRAGVRSDRAAPGMRVYHQAQGGLTTYKKKRIASVSAHDGARIVRAYDPYS